MDEWTFKSPFVGSVWTFFFYFCLICTFKNNSHHHHSIIKRVFLFIIPLGVNTTWKKNFFETISLRVRVYNQSTVREIKDRWNLGFRCIEAVIWNAYVGIWYNSDCDWWGMRDTTRLSIKFYSLGKQVSPRFVGMLSGSFKGQTKVTPHISLHMWFFLYLEKAKNSVFTCLGIDLQEATWDSAVCLPWVVLASEYGSFHGWSL